MLDNIHILVVDDAEYTRTMTLSMLHSIGFHTISEADDGLVALSAIRKSDINLVLLDVVMPNMGGLEVLREVRADSAISNLKIILVTAAADAKTILAARHPSTKADAVIVKPFSVATLKQKIQAVFEAGTIKK
jgi:two-component system, chemotaxis family, chemotaxis protein CheY